MKSATVFIAEDNEHWNQRIVEELTRAGHTIVWNARTLEDALNGISTLQKTPDLAVLDGNINPLTTGASDGREIAVKLRASYPNIIIVGVSASDNSWADIQSGKQGIERLAATISQIVR